jgi:membrane protease YdiL (CAAX protease family)
MDKVPLWSNKHLGVQFIYFLIVVFISVCLCSLISVLLINPLFGINLLNNPSILSDYENPIVVNALKLMQFFQVLGLFVIPAFILAHYAGNNKLKYLHLSSPPKGIIFILAVILMISAIPFINYLGYLNQSMQLPKFMKGVEEWMKQSEENAARLTIAFLKMDSIADLIVNLFVIAFLAAVGEELFFRGVIQKFFFKWTKNYHIAIIITGILFSAIHLQFYGFFPRMLMGILLGYLLVWTNSLWIPITAHFANNATAVVLSYLIQRKFFSENIGSDNSNMIYIIGSVIIVIIFILLIYKKSKRDSSEYYNQEIQNI